MIALKVKEKGEKLGIKETRQKSAAGLTRRHESGRKRKRKRMGERGKVMKEGGREEGKEEPGSPKRDRVQFEWGRSEVVLRPQPLHQNNEALNPVETAMGEYKEQKGEEEGN